MNHLFKRSSGGLFFEAMPRKGAFQSLDKSWNVIGELKKAHLRTVARYERFADISGQRIVVNRFRQQGLP